MLSADQLRRMVGARAMPKHAPEVAKAAAKWLLEYGITEPKEVAAIFATMGCETDFEILAENMNYTAERICEVWPHRFSKAKARRYHRQPKKFANHIYGETEIAEWLGNKGRPNAGWDYRGSGPGQITGYDEFLLVEKATGVKVVSNPHLLRKDVSLGVRATCVFWQHKKIGTPARNGDLVRVRKLYNGGSNGLKDFKTFYGRALRMLSEDAGVGDQVNPRPSAPEKQTKRNPKSSILPLFRPKQADAVTAAVMHKFESLTPADRRGDQVKILFVRGYYADSMGKKGANDRAMYDDACFVISPDGIQPFNANSDPSVFRKRVATIKANQAIRYKPGKHGLSRKDGGYPAFRQNSRITVARDGVGDDTDTAAKPFWCNLHRGGRNGTSSLGCLTIPTHQWNEFHGLVTRLLKKWDQETFHVTLVEYDGDKPPVTAAQVDVERIPANQETSDSVAASFLVVIGVAAWGWWERATTALGSAYDTVATFVGGLL